MEEKDFTEKHSKGKQSMYVGTCLATASHETTTCVPVTVCPFADSESISIECCGCPIIKNNCDTCCGTVNGRSEFTISQKLKINIPIAFGADVIIGDTYIHDSQIVGYNDGDCCICDCSNCEDDSKFAE